MRTNIIRLVMHDLPISGRLDKTPIGVTFAVRAVHAPPGAPEWGQQLEDIGFFPGEHVTVITRGFPGADPLAVRIGQSTFALRAAEAACIEVEALRK
jgi:ferrous iron transport protein A